MTAIPFTPKPHRIVVEVDAKYGDMRFSIECPYDEFHPERECLMGIEPTTPCQPYLDDGDCPEGGFHSSEVGHVHPVDQCWVVWQFHEIGLSWEEQIKWVGDFPDPATFPLDVWVAPDSDGATEVGLWPVKNGSSSAGADQ